MGQDKDDKEVGHMDIWEKNIPGRRKKGPRLVTFWPTTWIAKRSESCGGRGVEEGYGQVTRGLIITLGRVASWNLESGQLQ